MNPYLSKMLNEKCIDIVNTLLELNIITPNELKDQVLASHNSAYIYYGALAISKCKDTKDILEKLKEALFSLNDKQFIFDFMNNIAKTEYETYLDKLLESTEADILIKTLSFLIYCNSRLSEEKNDYYIEAIIKKLISLKAYAPLIIYLDNQNSKVCHIAIDNGDKDFLEAYHKYLAENFKNKPYDMLFDQYFESIRHRKALLNLQDNTLTPDETVGFLQALVEKNDYDTIKEYATNFHDLFTDEPIKTR